MTVRCRISTLTLELTWCDMNGQDAEWLSGVLTQCPALAHLDLNRNRIGSTGTEERLAGVLVPALVYLNLMATVSVTVRSKRREKATAMATVSVTVRSKRREKATRTARALIQFSYVSLSVV